MAGKIKLWSTTPGDNNSAPPNGWPEGMAPSAVNNTARQDRASVAEWYQDAEWIDYGHTIVTAAGQVYTISGDVTAIYRVGRAIRQNLSSAAIGIITNSVFSTPNTLVTVSGYVPSAAPTSVEVGLGDKAVSRLSAGTSAIDFATYSGNIQLKVNSVTVGLLTSTGLNAINIGATTPGTVAATTLSTTGDITVSNPSGSTITVGDGATFGVFTANGASGATAQFNFRSAGVNRWTFRKNTVAESGSNTGSDFEFRAFDDAGVLIDNPITITRAAGGAVTIARPTAFDANQVSGSNFSVTGGTITGITDLAVADGGTGASTAANARTNLGVAIGSDVQAYDAGLAALAAFNTNGVLVQTANNTFAGRTLTGTAAEITVTNGNGVSGNPTLSLPAALTFTGKTVTGGTFTGITDLAIADGGTGASTAAAARTNLGVEIGSDVQAFDADLSAIAALASTGIAVRSAANTWVQRTITTPNAGLTTTNGNGVSGNVIINPSDDLAAIEALGSTGIAVRSAANTWVQRTITGTTDQITVTNGNGVSGNPIINIGDNVERVIARGTMNGAANVTGTVITVPAGTWRELRLRLANVQAATDWKLAFYLNGSVTAAYRWAHPRVIETGAIEGQGSNGLDPYIVLTDDSALMEESDVANNPAGCEIVIFNAANTSNNKSIVYRTGGAKNINNHSCNLHGSGVWENTAAVTQFNVILFNGASTYYAPTAGGVWTLYGLPE